MTTYMRTSAEIARALFDAVARRVHHIWSFNSEAAQAHRRELLALSDRYQGLVATIEGDLAADRLIEAMDRLPELRTAREAHNLLCRDDEESISAVVAIKLAGRISVRLRRATEALSEPSPQRLAA